MFDNSTAVSQPSESEEIAAIAQKTAEELAAEETEQREQRKRELADLYIEIGMKSAGFAPIDEDTEKRFASLKNEFNKGFGSRVLKPARSLCDACTPNSLKTIFGL